MTTTRSALLIVNYGSHQLIADNLDRTTLPPDMSVVVVDNFTTAGERDAMRRLATARNWCLVEPRTNLGFGAGMNLAASRARQLGASVYVLLNPDAYIESDGLSRLVDHVVESEEAVVAPLVLRPDRSHFSSEMEMDWETGATRRLREDRRYQGSATWLSGACIAVHSDLWRKIGGFNDDYFLYWEDIDFSVRAAKAGGILQVDQNIVAFHDAGGTQTRGRPRREKSSAYNYFNARNRLVFATQHLDGARRREWQRRSASAGWEILLRSGKRSLLNPFRTVVPVVRGTIAGFMYMRSTRGGR